MLDNITEQTKKLITWTVVAVAALTTIVLGIVYRKPIGKFVRHPIKTVQEAWNKKERSGEEAKAAEKAAAATTEVPENPVDPAAADPAAEEKKEKPVKKKNEKR